jgi:8-amino-7-oxononanoate synthase
VVRSYAFFIYVFQLMLNRLETKLLERKQAGNLRSLSLLTAQYDFFSNDYLGLARNTDLQRQIDETYLSLPERTTGATGSRLLSGNSKYATNLEEKLAHLFHAEAALLFNSGYNANSAIIACLAQKGDVIIFDELIHASLREGYRLSFANHIPFKHNSLEDLEHKLRANQNANAIFVILESVYSMDGDNCALPEMLGLCAKYNAQVIVDEAHSTGVFGKGGNGLVCELGLEHLCLARVYTFGKAIGSHGACVVGSRILIDYLINFARSFIFTTAAPLHNLVSIACSFEYIAQNPDLQQDLVNKITYYHLIFRQCYEQKKKDTTAMMLNQSPIQVIPISGNEACKNIAKHLINNDFEVRAILAPTVKVGEERLRICLHSFNAEQQISALLKTLFEELG